MKEDKETQEKILSQIKNMMEERDLVISTDQTGGTLTAPNSKKKFWRTLPFALAPDTFTKDGHNKFFLGHYAPFGFYFFKEEGLIKPLEEKSKQLL